jgi:hypothetical protein
MWNFITQPGLASAVVDFTSELSPVIVGLLGLVGLSAGMIVFAAIRYHRSQRTQPTAGTAPASTDQREAA